MTYNVSPNVDFTIQCRPASNVLSELFRHHKDITITAHPTTPGSVTFESGGFKFSTSLCHVGQVGSITVSWKELSAFFRECKTGGEVVRIHG